MYPRPPSSDPWDGQGLLAEDEYVILNQNQVPADVVEAFASYVAELSARWASETDPLAMSLLAAARLLTGDASAARVIVNRLPPTYPKLDLGAYDSSLSCAKPR